jgi:N-dimethylarginine dimethylaminohydrolase
MFSRAPNPYPGLMITRERRAVPRRYLMCPPEHFAVTYAINPWMAPDQPTDRARAMRQWARLRQVYLDLGHQVRTITPVPGLLGLNAVSDGRHVVLPVQAATLAGQLFQRGFVPVGVDRSELLKGGGGAKCCTLELRS